MIRRVKVVITESLSLPRFSVEEGFEWEVRPDRLTKDGFTLGGGFVKNSQFKVNGFVERKT